MTANLALLRERRDAIRDLAARHGARAVRVFGSSVRGEDGEQSDIDLLVEFEDGRSLFDQVALRDELAELLGGPVDVVAEDALHWLLRRRILEEARPL